MVTSLEWCPLANRLTCTSLTATRASRLKRVGRTMWKSTSGNLWYARNVEQRSLGKLTWDGMCKSTSVQQIGLVTSVGNAGRHLAGIGIERAMRKLICAKRFMLVYEWSTESGMWRKGGLSSFNSFDRWRTNQCCDGCTLKVQLSRIHWNQHSERLRGLWHDWGMMRW